MGGENEMVLGHFARPVACESKVLGMAFVFVDVH